MAAPALTEVAQGISTAGRKIGRAILRETHGITPSGIRRSAKSVLDELNPQLDEAAIRAGQRPAARISGLLAAPSPEMESIPLGETPTPGEMPEFSGPGVWMRRPSVFEAPPAEEGTPMNFPEARAFYSKVSRLTQKPRFLRRMIESPNMPDLRFNAGAVREALNNDIIDAANRLGRGEDYSSAMREFRNNARLRKAAKVGGALLAGEAARRSGTFGKAAKTASGMF